MSEQAPEAPAKRGNIFTNKIGPLPMWAWLGISLAILLGWAYYQSRKQSQSSPTDTANASQVPQFVNQTYTTVQPPGGGPPVPGKKRGDPCTGDMYWDPDADGGRGRCVPEKDHKKPRPKHHHKKDDS